MRKRKNWVYLSLLTILMTSSMLVAASPCNKKSCDRIAPTGYISTPEPGSVVYGSVLVSGTATDNVGVARVEVGIDGGPFVTALGTTEWSTYIDATLLSDGQHYINVRFWDFAKNKGTATSTIEVRNSVPPPPSPSPSPSPSPDVSIMPLVKGLSTRWSYSSELPNYIQRVSWSDLQPSAFGPIVHPNPIDQAISREVPFRVRLLAGRYSPQWVLDLGSVTIVDTFLGANQAYTVPRWWTDGYVAAYSDLIRKLAAEYDGRIPAITMSGPMTLSAEPFLHQLASADSKSAVLAAGWSTSAEEAAFKRMIDVHASAFLSTRTFIAINPGQTYDPITGKWNLEDVSYMRKVTDYFVMSLGQRAIVQNNSLNVTRATKNTAYMAMYDYMKGLYLAGTPISFQTAQTSLVEDLPWVLDYAVSAGAHLVELPAEWDTLDTAEHLAWVDEQLRLNEPD